MTKTILCLVIMFMCDFSAQTQLTHVQMYQCLHVPMSLMDEG